MKSLLVIALSLFLLFLISCGTSIEQDVTLYPITLTDQAGREIDILEPTDRIVSGYYISSSVCIALGLTDRLVGIEARAETRPIYALAAPALLDLPNVGTARDFNLEACIALEPNLVILPNHLRDAADILTDMGIPVILLNPESYEEIIEMFILIGKATDTQERAEQIAEYFEESRVEIEKVGANIADKPNVYVAGVSSWLSTAPKDMYQSTLVEIAGGINVAGDINGSSWMEISYEQLLAFNPDIIILPSEAGYEIDEVLNDPAIKELNAVKTNMVYKMPSDFEAWDSPIPASMLGARWLLHILHGDIYPFEYLQQATTEFYLEFFSIVA